VLGQAQVVVGGERHQRPAAGVLGIGEGGFVLCRDPSLIQDIRTRANFGFLGHRESIVPALNAKMSEYHAAVGNAALDEWTGARAEWLAVVSGGIYVPLEIYEIAKHFRNLVRG
jgi:hypothetical protein